MSLQSQVDELGARLSGLIRRLHECGYVFDRPEAVLPGPDPRTAEVIDRISREVGPVPEALALFWLRVGSVDLSGSHPDWKEPAQCPDQLIVFPASLALYHLEDDEGGRLEYDLPFQIVVAPDELHKANTSGGPPYSVSVPSEAMDPPLHNSPEVETFLEHIDRALRCGGFPGLAGCKDHGWPLDSLKC